MLAFSEAAVLCFSPKQVSLLINSACFSDAGERSCSCTVQVMDLLFVYLSERERVSIIAPPPNRHPVNSTFKIKKAVWTDGERTRSYSLNMFLCA